MRPIIVFIAIYTAITSVIYLGYVASGASLPDLLANTFDSAALDLLLSSVGGAIAIGAVVYVYFRVLPAQMRDNYHRAKVAISKWLGQPSIGEIALLCIVVGIGEEVFFRAFLQGALSVWLDSTSGHWVALGIASLCFGLAHAVTRTYALLAGTVGLLLGLQLLFTKDLLGPILSHAIYDFLVLVAMIRYDYEPNFSRGKSA